MPVIYEITDLTAPELDIYARLTQAQLRNRLEPEKGIFIAESPKVIARALDAAGSLSGSSFYKYIPCAFFCQQKGQNKKKKRWKTSIALLAPLA